MNLKTENDLNKMLKNSVRLGLLGVKLIARHSNFWGKGQSAIQLQLWKQNLSAIHSKLLGG